MKLAYRIIAITFGSNPKNHRSIRCALTNLLNRLDYGNRQFYRRDQGGAAYQIDG